jgi:SH3 domain-containing protein
MELRVIEKEAQVEELQTRLEDTRDEVVRTMAKLETAASRAEAASGMAEAEVALQSLRTSASGQQIPEIPQAQRLVQQSSGEFNKQNFGGALYLAQQAKTIAAAGRSRLAGGNRAGSARPGETPFALPIRLKVESRGNVREGPGTNYDVAFEVQRGAILTGYSYADEWVRVSDDAGRSGWIFRPLIGRP